MNFNLLLILFSFTLTFSCVLCSDFVERSFFDEVPDEEETPDEESGFLSARENDIEYKSYLKPSSKPAIIKLKLKPTTTTTPPPTVKVTLYTPQPVKIVKKKKLSLKKKVIKKAKKVQPLPAAYPTSSQYTTSKPVEESKFAEYHKKFLKQKKVYDEQKQKTLEKVKGMVSQAMDKVNHQTSHHIDIVKKKLEFNKKKEYHHDESPDYVETATEILFTRPKTERPATTKKPIGCSWLLKALVG